MWITAKQLIRSRQGRPSLGASTAIGLSEQEAIKQVAIGHGNKPSAHRVSQRESKYFWRFALDDGGTGQNGLRAAPIASFPR